MANSYYDDFLYKKFKPKSDVLENLLETTEQQLVKINEIQSLYNVSIPTQDDVWICGRVFSENAGSGGGKLTEHNVAVQGSYVCSNSHSIPLNLANCLEYSLFPGQIVLVNGRNPDGKRFFCKEIIEPIYVAASQNTKKTIKNEELDVNWTNNNKDNAINVKLEPNEDLTCIVASGPFMMTNSISMNTLYQMIDLVKTKNAHILILLQLGPFIDINHDLIASGNIQLGYEELLQNILDEISARLASSRTQVIIQSSLNDITQEPIYPVHPYAVSAQFIKQNDSFHFLHEPSLIKINGIVFAITTTDVIKDLTSIAVSKTHSSDKISRNFAHLLRQRSFYPIYPPPDNICIDYEAWDKHVKIYTNPKVFIAVSDLATFSKEINNCTCLNPGRLVKGTSTGTYAQIIISHTSLEESQQTKTFKVQNQAHMTNVSVTFNKI